MTAPDHTLDPHLEEVLRDIENDPRARMFQTSPRQLVTGLRERAPRIGTQQFGLTSAERELVQVHREEVAQLLCTAAKTEIVVSDKPRTPLARWLTVDKKLELPSREQWLSNAEYCRSVLPGELHASPATVLLGQRLANGGLASPTAYEMALASMRLVPRSRTRVVMAYAMMEEGQDESALHALQDVLRGRTQALTRSIALVNVSTILERRNEIQRALESLVAGQVCRQNPVPRLSAFCLCLRMGDAGKALSAAADLESVVDADHPAVVEFVHNKERRHHPTDDKPTPECKRLIATVKDKLPSAARRIASVYS